MGTNKRYAHVIDRRMDEQILQRVAASGELQTLTAEELRLDQVPLTVDPQPHRQIRAWVRFGMTAVRVDALAARWTADAVGIIFTTGQQEHRCWVWAGAVDDTQRSSDTR